MGHFIVIEGLEGAGKSTAIQIIDQFLTHHHQTVIKTREPGGTETGEVIRSLVKGELTQEPLDPMSELLLMYAARVQLVERVIKPALTAHQWVLADRFELSSLAYQGGGRQLGVAKVEALSSLCLPSLRPDLTIYLDIDPVEGLKRAQKRSEFDRFEAESLTFFEAIRQAYLEQAKKSEHIVTVDAQQPLPVIQDTLIAILRERFNALH